MPTCPPTIAGYDRQRLPHNLGGIIYPNEFAPTFDEALSRNLTSHTDHPLTALRSPGMPMDANTARKNKGGKSRGRGR